MGFIVTVITLLAPFVSHLVVRFKCPGACWDLVYSGTYQRPQKGLSPMSEDCLEEEPTPLCAVLLEKRL